MLNNCQNAIFAGAPPNLDGTKYFDLPCCHNHLFTKASFCVLASVGHALNSFIYNQIAQICVVARAIQTAGKGKLKIKLRAGRQIHQLTSLSVFQRRQQTCKCTLSLDYRSVYRP